MINLPLNVDFSGKVVVVTGAGGVLCGDMARAYAQAGAKVAGCAIVIEKSFQGGGDEFRAKGYKIESLARVKSIENGTIEFL